MTEEARPTVEPMATPLRILLVEDDEFDVAVFGRAFHRSETPCEIVRCHSGEQALEGLRDAEIELDLLVADHLLPGLSGFELCLKLIDRYQPPAAGGTGPPFALVLLTGVGSEQMAIKALRAGINDYIVKDASREYLDLLPLVLPRVAQRHRRRRPRKLTARHNIIDPRTAPTAAESESDDPELSACVDMVRERGGRIWLEADAGARGSGGSPALHFSVPLAPDELAFWTAATGTADDDLNEPSGAVSGLVDESSRHVLIVHPNAIVTFVARRAAERSGCRAAAVENGRKAIEALDREPFDLVLMALDMPMLDGLETTRRIRRHEDGTGGRISILALGADDDDAERCYQAGMDGAVTPPVSVHSLKAAIERWG